MVDGFANSGTWLTNDLDLPGCPLVVLFYKLRYLLMIAGLDGQRQPQADVLFFCGREGHFFDSG